MTANERQIGGSHYKCGEGEEHWDRVHRLGLDYYQACVTKYVERCWKKNGLQDLEKARHFLDKYIELKTPERTQFKTPNEVRVETLPPAAVPTGAQYAVTSPFGNFTVPAPIKRMEQPRLYPYVKPTGWVSHQFEGVDSEGSLWRCRTCHEHFRSPVNACPDDYHPCRLDSNVGAEPTGCYTNQG